MPSEVRNPGGTGPVVAKGLINTMVLKLSKRVGLKGQSIQILSSLDATGNTRTYFLVNIKQSLQVQQQSQS